MLYRVFDPECGSEEDALNYHAYDHETAAIKWAECEDHRRDYPVSGSSDGCTVVVIDADGIRKRVLLTSQPSIQYYAKELEG